MDSKYRIGYATFLPTAIALGLFLASVGVARLVTGQWNTDLSIVLALVSLIVSLVIETHQTKKWIGDATQDLSESLGKKADAVTRLAAKQATRTSIAIRQQSEQIETLYDRIHRTHAFERFDSSEDIAAHVAPYLYEAKVVRNTFVQLGIFDDPETHAAKGIVGLYEMFLSKEGTEWRDVVSLQELFSPRFKEIAKGASQEAPVRKIPGTHQITVLRHNVPLVNFILISDRNRKFTRVYFGWIVDEDHRASPVCHTTDPDVVAMFERYHLMLERTKHMASTPFKVNYAKEGIHRLAAAGVFDRTGSWVTVAYRSPGLNSASQHSPPSIAIESIGVLGISFEPSGTNLTGRIHYLKPKREALLKAEGIVVSGSAMHFRYENDLSRRGLLDREGSATYNFKDAPFEHIEGHLVEPTDAVWLKLYGVRIPSDPNFVGQIGLDDPHVHRAVHRIQEMLANSVELTSDIGSPRLL